MRTATAALAGLALATAAHAQDPHAGHGAAAPPPDPHAAHRTPPAPATATAAPPPVPTDFEADRHFPPAQMAVARARLRREHGRILWSKVMFETLELRPVSGTDGYAWEGRASFGGDIDRLVVSSRGEGAGRLERGETQLLWGRAISPWFNLAAGARQDLQDGGRTHAVLGIDGHAPYEFDVEAAVFLSTRGEVTARLEAAHDYRLTQRLILEPSAEAELATRTVASQEVGAGLSRVELGLRLLYAITPQVAPYVGVTHERAIGRTVRLVRAVGEDPRQTRLVLGLRAWF